MNRRKPEIFDVYRLDVASGEMERIAENPGNIQTWITDHEGRLRLAVTTDGCTALDALVIPTALRSANESTATTH